MASFNITGFLKVKGETTQVSERFTKRDFVIDYDLEQQYPQIMQLQLTQDKCSLLDSIELGAEMKISFSIQCKEYTPKDGGEKKYFNTVNAWRIETTGRKINAPQPVMPAQESSTAFKQSNNVQANNDIVDDLPF